MKLLNWTVITALLTLVANNFGAFTDPYNKIVLKQHHDDDTRIAVPQACLTDRHQLGVLTYDDGPTVNDYYCQEINNWQVRAKIRRGQTNDLDIEKPSSTKHFN